MVLDRNGFYLGIKQNQTAETLFQKMLAKTWINRDITYIITTPVPKS